MRDQAEQQKEAEAFAFMARWNSPDFFRARSSWHKISDVFDAHPDDQTAGSNAVKQLLISNSEERTRQNVRHMMNFLEELAIAVRFSHADEVILRSFFEGIVQRFHKSLCTWVPEHRNTVRRQDVWAEFDTLCKRWGV